MEKHVAGTDLREALQARRRLEDLTPVLHELTGALAEARKQLEALITYADFRDRYIAHLEAHLGELVAVGGVDD